MINLIFESTSTQLGLPKRISEVIIVMTISPFGWWEENATLEFIQGDVRIFDIEDEKYLFVGQTMYASTTERSWYIKNVYPYAKGKCLELGLGLGVASKVILANDNVTHLLTIEEDGNVIGAFGKPLVRHNILHFDAMKWVASFPRLDPMYDFIFVDHYTFEEEELGLLQGLASGLKYLLKPGGEMVFWVDENAPEEDQNLIRDLWILN
jgi:spermidine synthase